jgi:hypothetical protein
MLPKLQQSSLANTLRRDNLASQIQCTPFFTKARTNFAAFWASRTTSPTSHGRTHTHPKTHIHPSEIFPKSTSPTPNSKRPPMNPFTNSPSRDPSQKIHVLRASEARLRALSKKKQISRNLYRNLALSRSEKCRLPSSEGTMIAEIYPSGSTTKTHFPNWYGKFQSNHSTTTTTCPFSSTALGKNLTPIVRLPLWEHTTC